MDLIKCHHGVEPQLTLQHRRSRRVTVAEAVGSIFGRGSKPTAFRCQTNSQKMTREFWSSPCRPFQRFVLSDRSSGETPGRASGAWRPPAADPTGLIGSRTLPPPTCLLYSITLLICPPPPTSLTPHCRDAGRWPTRLTLPP